MRAAVNTYARAPSSAGQGRGLPTPGSLAVRATMALASSEQVLLAPNSKPHLLHAPCPCSTVP